jgi:hypothetical protein
MAVAVPYAATWDQFQRAIWHDGSDRESRVLNVSPWADKKDPLQWLRIEPQDAGRAFLVDTKLPEMRQVDHLTTRLIGVETCTWGIVYDGELPAVQQIGLNYQPPTSGQP